MKCSPAVGAATAPFFPREHGLIVAAVLLIRRAARGDVRRQRHGAERDDGLIECRPRNVESKRHRAVLAARLDRRLERAEQADIAALPEDDPVAGFSRLAGRARACQRLGRQPLDQRHRDARLVRAALSNAVQLGGDHAGVVEHERIARLEQIRQVEDRLVGKRLACVRIDDEQPRRVARSRGPKRDQLLGKMVVEMRRPSRISHGRAFARPSISRRYGSS